jgi:hypothetical protein
VNRDYVRFAILRAKEIVKPGYHHLKEESYSIQEILAKQHPALRWFQPWE